MGCTVTLQSRTLPKRFPQRPWHLKQLLTLLLLFLSSGRVVAAGLCIKRFGEAITQTVAQTGILATTSAVGNRMTPRSEGTGLPPVPRDLRGTRKPIFFLSI